MSITTGSAHLPALGKHAREETGAELQATLLELLDLSLIGKQLHWSVTGPLFRPLHLYLDELIDSWRSLADTVAERAVAVGVWPDG
jgi:starvation-inducible DNA-binding protein